MLQAEFPAYALPCIKARETLNCTVVLVEHNVEYDRIKTQVDELSETQYENLKAIEIDLCNRSDAVVCVSDNDRQKLGEDGVYPDLLHTVPHGVDLAQFDSPSVVDARKKFNIPDGRPVLVYHGTYSYPPNREALQDLRGNPAAGPGSEEGWNVPPPRGWPDPACRPAPIPASTCRAASSRSAPG